MSQTSSNPDIRKASLTDALVPLGLLIALLSLSVYFYGADSSYGPNQIALLLSAGVVALMGMKNGHSWSDMEGGMLHGIGLVFGAILILLAVGALIGSWILAGTVPSMIYFGVQILSPQWFYAASCLICAIVGLSIGSSWTTAGTLGVALMGISGALGLNPAITAGAVISGAYFGDKMSPLSDTTNVAAAVTSNDLFLHIRHMLWTTMPAFLAALIIFSVFGFTADTGSVSATDIEQLLAALREEFNISLVSLIPLALLLIMAWRKIPAYPTLIIGSLVGCAIGLIFEPETARRLGGGDSFLAAIKGAWYSLFDGYKSTSSNENVAELLSKGGMSSMLNTVWLIISAMAFGGAMERAGFLQVIVDWTLSRVKTVGGLVTATVFTCFGMNAAAGDQYMAIIIPGRMFRDAFADKGLHGLNLSRTLEDSGTITSVLIPWNTCGAYMSATLGVATFAYAPYALFNLICPLLAITYGWFHFKQMPLSPATSQR
ncbi:Na+/H+ antiporter NhaC [Microbulbifer thermotolerans]|uniref:Na+/H+ antiporter NhaC n=1 Tax=Microbulbifer thermotolerans TaxID=252514 RepID=A0A143HNN2_MICTH|nr:Na+/H+ antiporter NhaC [Microbulbifer thermotolerans]AMX03111.1 Na+/H+ antiporter NhaC [Microbulbifer thermotolerans]MCX2801913.1 Na+/H+ antiporter NhaC [Microbulbifer thermotolerans]MCX2831497.1 Na+/H+ antiporter NhaC [Microbulbifer thermotolerans]MCX2835855.1 Na+/H+ antiporter NhaC [Microbulbifer thermotolerans]